MTGEPSWRLFAVELRRATQVLEGRLITELGANPGRLFMVGIATMRTDRGIEVRDHSDSIVFTLTRRTELGDFEVPGYVMVHGNLRVQGTQTIFADYVMGADRSLMEEWTAEALLLLVERLEAVVEAERSGASRLVELGYSPFAASCAERALSAYGSVDVEYYRALAAATRLALMGEAGTMLPIPTPETADPESLVLSVIRSLGGEASYEEILAGASRRGLDRVSVDSALDSLISSGLVEEVSLNVFRLRGGGHEGGP